MALEIMLIYNVKVKSDFLPFHMDSPMISVLLTSHPPWGTLGIGGGQGQEITVTLHSSEINPESKQAAFNVSQASTEVDPAQLHLAQTDACTA